MIRMGVSYLKETKYTLHTDKGMNGQCGNNEKF